MNTLLLRNLLKQKLLQNPELLQELNIASPSELSNITDQQLEILLSPKLLGLLDLTKEELEL